MTRARLACVLLATLLFACATCSPAGAARVVTLKVQTVPALRGIPVAVDGRVLRTDERGAVKLPAEVPVQRGRASLREVVDSLTVLGASIRPGVRAELGRWYAIRGWRRPLARRYVLHAALDVSYTVRPKFVDPGGRVVDRSRVSSVVFRSSDGAQQAFKGTETPRLHGTRIVRVGSRLRTEDIQYSVQRVVVDGTNVVNTGQLRFSPRHSRQLKVGLRFYPATFVVRDALFGFSTGSAIRLRFPDGRTKREELNSDGEVRLTALPRGDYEVDVEAPGVLAGSTVSLSRPQRVELKVVSYLDLAVAVFALSAIAALLFLAGRLKRGRPLRHRREPLATPNPVVHWVSQEGGPPVKVVDFLGAADGADGPEPGGRR